MTANQLASVNLTQKRETHRNLISQWFSLISRVANNFPSSDQRIKRLLILIGALGAGILLRKLLSKLFLRSSIMERAPSRSDGKTLSR